MKKQFLALGVLFALLCVVTLLPALFQKRQDLPSGKNISRNLKIPFISLESGVFTYGGATLGARLGTGSVDYTFSRGTSSPLQIRETFPGLPQGIDASPVQMNYFRGSNRSQWKTSVPAFNEVRYESWPGVSVSFAPQKGGVEKIITLEPHANPSQISFGVNNAALYEQEDGSLLVQTKQGSVVLSAPVAFQMIAGRRVPVEVSYVIQGKEHLPSAALLMRAVDLSFTDSIPAFSQYGFSLGSYDPAYPVTIDPIIAATFLGSSDEDQPFFIFRDSGTGTIYVAGTAYGADFPTTGGSLRQTAQGREFFVARFSSDLSTLMAATYVGGDNDEQTPGAAFGVSDGIYVTGTSGSSDFPTITGAFQETPAALGTTVVIFKISLNLASLQASTYLSGPTNFKEYEPRSIVVDGSHVYVSGDTTSPDFPTTSGAYDETASGLFDGFISKFSTNLNTLEASTYLGGSGDDFRLRVSVDSGHVYVAGDTTSANFPVTLGAYDQTLGGTQDMFASRLSSDLTTLEASTYLGGSGDETYSVSTFAQSSFFVLGAVPDGFPVTTGAYDESHNGGNDGSISRLSSDLTTLEASTYLGGTSNDIASGVFVSSSPSRVYTLGQTLSSNFPTTSRALRTSFASDGMGYISALSLDLSSLQVSTYIGGPEVGASSQVYDMVFDADDNPYVVGITTATDFPVTSGAYDQISNGGNDIFIAHLSCDFAAVCGSLATVVTVSASSTEPTRGSLSGNVTNDGATTITERGFAYGNTTIYTATSTESGSFSTGTFSATLTGLTCSSTYHYAAYAINSSGLSYGSDDEFVTAPCPPGTVFNTGGVGINTSTSGGSNGAIVNSGPIAPVSAGVGGGNGPASTTDQQIPLTTVDEVPVLISGVDVATSSPVVSESKKNGFRFARDLQYHDRGEDVRKLQILLNTLGSPLAATGPGSPGKETSIFGIRTYRALAVFQLEHNIEPTGYLGALTRKVLETIGN